MKQWRRDQKRAQLETMATLNNVHKFWTRYDVIPHYIIVTNLIASVLLYRNL